MKPAKAAFRGQQRGQVVIGKVRQVGIELQR
jgi:hypothetical protein